MTIRIRKEYEIWATQGQGGVLVETVTSLVKAKKYIRKRKGEASFMIMKSTREPIFIK